MEVLIVGSGGREHALAWKLSQSANCGKLYCAPGNAGIAEFAEVVPVAADDIEGLKEFALTRGIDFIVVGPEVPLVLGLVDAIRGTGIKIFGPDAAAARLEGSKGFTKNLCTRYGIPTARYDRFSDPEKACEFIRQTGAPIVIKADGLAAGKGVIIAASVNEAIEAAGEMLRSGAFGKAGEEIVIEEFLEGEEVSYFALTDGKNVLPLNSAQDHKRAFDGDKGPNTGGMGAYSPARQALWTPELEQKTLERIIWPTVKGMAAEGCPFTGVLYAGLMICKGEPYLIEYNARFGDPECQPLMMRWQGDLLEVLLAAAEGRLDRVQGKVSWSDEASLCVVMAAQGYPGAYQKGTPVRGLEKAGKMPLTRIFHAGTAGDSKGGIVSNGGRVLGVTSTGATISQARERAYKAVDAIDWPQGFCRRDIGWRAL